MNLFQQFATDPELETKGIYLEYGNNSKKLPIRIRIARAGGSNKAFAKELEIETRPYRRQIQNETIDMEVLEEIMRKVVAKTIVLGWENVEDEYGEDFPFSQANCIDLFTKLPDMYADIRAQAEKASLFRKEMLENDGKN